ncbi:hypothetical protein C5E10_16860 [Pseudoclavibacter sp. RFBG4]|nr:hypothetical protein C5E10_16860 [Pseudoclavibacter sp. RFBG4]
MGRAREDAEQVTPPSSDGDDFFARYRPKAASPSAPEADDDEADDAESAAPEPQSYLRSRRRFNPDLRATGERDIVAPNPVAAEPFVPPTPAAPRKPAVPPAVEPPVEEPAPASTPAAADAPAAPGATGPVRDAFAFEPPTTEFDVLPMSTPTRAAGPSGASSRTDDDARGQVPSWFSDLEGTGDPAPAASAPAAPAEPEAPAEPAAPAAPAAAAPTSAAPQFGRPPVRADDATAAANAEPSEATTAAPQAPASSPKIPSFRADPPAAPTPRVVPSPPPMPATGDPFRGASAAPVFPSGPAVVPGEPPRAAPAASSAFDELLAGERSDGSVLDDSDRPIVSRDFEQTGIVPLPSRTRESFGGAQESERQDAADLFGAPAAPAAPAAQTPPAPSAPQPPRAPQPPVVGNAPDVEPATRALPRQGANPGFDQAPVDDRDRRAAADAAAASVGGAAASAASASPARDTARPPRSDDGQREQDPAKELLSSWFDEDDASEQPSTPASAGPRAPRRPARAAKASAAPAGAPPRSQAPTSAGPVGDGPDLEPSERNPFDRVGAALGGGNGGGGGRMGAAVRGLDNRNRRRLGVIALSVVGSILLILSAIMIGNVVGANRDDPVAGGDPTASETAAEQPATEDPTTPAGPAAVADTNFAPVTFTSETGNIRCQITPETGVTCQQYTVDFPVPEQACQAGATGVVVGLDSNGYTFPCLTADIPTEGAVVQPYNSPVVLGEFVCEITFETGVTCFNASGDIVSVEYSAGVGQAGRLSATNPTPAAGQ